MDDFQYVRQVDFGRIVPGDRFSQKLFDRSSGATNAAVSYIHTPPGGGSPRGLHTHEFEQIFYVLDGTMAIEVAGQRLAAGPGSLIVFPAGLPHRNWNDTDQPTVHIAISAPAPAPRPDAATSAADQTTANG